MALNFLAAGAALGASALGSASASHQATKYRRLARRRGKVVIGDQLRRMNQLYASGLEHKTQALGAVREGRTLALQEGTRQLRTARRQLAEREVQASGAVRQDLTSRGLAGTSVARSEENRVRAATDRAADELFSGFAAQRSSIYSQFAAAEAAALSDLGQFYQTRYATEATDYYQPLFELQTGSPRDWSSSSGGVDASGIFELLTALFGGDK